MDRVARIRDAYKRCQAAGAEWIEATLNLARELYEARQEHVSNQAFSAWLSENELDDVSRHERIALLKIAQHADLFREVMAGSSPLSFEWCWTEKLLPRLPDSPADASALPELPIMTATAPENEHPIAVNDAIAEDIETAHETKSEKPAPAAPKILTDRSPLRDLPDYELVLAYVKDAHTRAVIHRAVKQRKGGKLFWALLVESITREAFGPPSHAKVSNPSLRAVLPWAPVGYAQRFNLLEPDSQTMVRQEVFPAIAPHLEILRQHPDRLPEIVRQFMQAKHEAARTRRETARQAAAVATMPVAEKPIIIYGRHMWPWTETERARWTYQEACEAAWFFRVIQPFLRHVGTPHEQATAVNIFLRWMPLRASGWAAAVRWIGQAYEDAPDGTIEVAPSPSNFGM